MISLYKLDKTSQSIFNGPNNTLIIDFSVDSI